MIFYLMEMRRSAAEHWNVEAIISGNRLLMPGVMQVLFRMARTSRP
jgi:hypothetical protein